LNKYFIPDEVSISLFNMFVFLITAMIAASIKEILVTWQVRAISSAVVFGTPQYSTLENDCKISIIMSRFRGGTIDGV
jgi:hypothetical protein